MKSDFNYYPIIFSRRIKPTIWGGYRLYGPEVDGNQHLKAFLPRIGEVWSLCDHSNVLALNGKYRLMALREILDMAPPEFFGAATHSKYRELGIFPMLFKIIDANDKLSIQVHPDDSMARRLENAPQGKSEMWYVIDAVPGAEIVLGFSKPFGAHEIEEAVKNDKLVECLNVIKVKKGDVYYIPSGRVHAIGEGILLAEIQQNCDITYRLNDYGRLGLDMKPRELHIEKAMKCLNFDDAAPDAAKPAALKKGGGEMAVLCDFEHFKVILYEYENGASGVFVNDEEELSVFMNIGDDLEISFDDKDARGHLSFYSALIMPARLEKFSFRALESGGKVSLLRTFIKNPLRIK